MLLIINSDQTLNAMVENLDHVCLDTGCECIDLSEQTRENILGDVPFEEALWDSDHQKVIHDPDFIVGGVTWRQHKAGERINQFYPLSKQMNLLRSGDKSAIKSMSLFIDKCRKWSNDLNIAVEVIDRLTP